MAKSDIIVIGASAGGVQALIILITHTGIDCWKSYQKKSIIFSADGNGSNQARKERRRRATRLGGGECTSH